MVKPYGEILNRIVEGCGYPEPEVGMKATEMLCNDRRAYEITRVELKDGKAAKFWMRPCEIINVQPIGPGYNAEGGAIIEGTAEVEVKKTKLGQWRVVETHVINDEGKISRRSTGNVVAPGINDAYRCPEI